MGRGDLKELEQTSSASRGDSWAGELAAGFCSYRVQGTPEAARVSAHSQPARPPPMMTMEGGAESDVIAGSREAD